MRRVFLTVLMCLLPAILAAQEERPPIDWAIVFAENAALVETITHSSGLKIDKLTMPSGIVVDKIYIEDGTRYRTRDPNGAVGCTIFRYMHLSALLEKCPEERDSKRGQEFAAAFEMIRDFAGENAVPPIPKEENDLLFLQGKAEYMKLLGRGKNQCGIIDSNHFQTFASEKIIAQVPEFLSIPRLPVMGNCL